METIYDWLSVAVFAGLIVLFLQRSAQEKPRDKMIYYAPPTIGCAVANYVGNHGYALFFYLIIAAILVYVWYVLKPLER
ncbi:XrtV sorting system accessory protein [Sphingomonas sp.]|uniref:XrtV sorting system accessory protein n=1 Tax=Sphingomonas sp. TaxID=28214 RepID=UPI001B2E09B2|nr:XrtV sorting system accessory protein [Sphingomonas sp.]MBO9714527.1 hypothetical protein [Sphingomonas sp.]